MGRWAERGRIVELGSDWWDGLMAMAGMVHEGLARGVGWLPCQCVEFEQEEKKGIDRRPQLGTFEEKESIDFQNISSKHQSNAKGN